MQYFFDNVTEDEMIEQMFRLLKEGKKEEADGVAYLIALNRLYKNTPV